MKLHFHNIDHRLNDLYGLCQTKHYIVHASTGSLLLFTVAVPVMYNRIFKMWEIQNIHFVMNLIGDIFWNVCDTDTIVVTSVILITQSINAVFCRSLILFLCNSPILKLQCKLREKRTRWRANLFWCQSLTFYFSAYHSEFTFRSILGKTVWEN